MVVRDNYRRITIVKNVKHNALFLLIGHYIQNILRPSCLPSSHITSCHLLPSQFPEGNFRSLTRGDHQPAPPHCGSKLSTDFLVNGLEPKVRSQLADEAVVEPRGLLEEGAERAQEAAILEWGDLVSGAGEGGLRRESVYAFVEKKERKGN